MNPLHVDPALAERAGFPAPILHGLCTYGYAMRAAVNHLCGGAVEQVKSFTARFSDVVFPQDALRIQAWPSTCAGIARLQVDVGDRTVLSHGVLELS